LAWSASSWADIVRPVFFKMASIAVAVLSLIWHFGRSDSILQKWAQQKGFHLVKQQYCWFFTGPFFWTSSRGQTVYFVTVVDEAGNQRNAWVRCGGWFLGLLSDHVDVAWDD
jgi:hypothetical protein